MSDAYSDEYDRRHLYNYSEEETISKLRLEVQTQAKEIRKLRKAVSQLQILGTRIQELSVEMDDVKT